MVDHNIQKKFILIEEPETTKYPKALLKMEELHAKVVLDPQHQGYLIFQEHFPTVTVGKRHNLENLYHSPEELKQKNIELFFTNRGGDVTAHEPGQAVIYQLDRPKSIKKFISDLEESMIAVCKHFGIQGERHPEYPGLWVNHKKIGSVGVSIQQRVTSHGLAFNVCNTLDTFKAIRPCGLSGIQMTTLSLEVGQAISLDEVWSIFRNFFMIKS